jgi:predicted TIM-barrel fold metal-dependent hydrolase
MMWLKRNAILNTIYNISGWLLTLQVVDFICHRMYASPAKAKGWAYFTLNAVHDFLGKLKLVLFEVKNGWWQALILLAVILFFKSGRNFLWFLARNMFSFLKKLPGKQTTELFKRYLNIGRYAFHKTQGKTLEQLENQYPEGTGFVILPMDMEYMDAGPVHTPYRQQMEELAALHEKEKSHLYPFVFADPRRIAAEPDYFDYEVKDGEVVLKNCFIKEYIEVRNFSGFKIYPALGYYPFDPHLLALWKYAEQKQLPVLTHCVKGPMYYRGSKKKEWDTHPIIKEKTATAGVYQPLLLPETKNDLFTPNFTHPLNFVCLLEKEWLRKAVNQAYRKTGDERIKELFGLSPDADDEKAAISTGLKQLKLCMAHYGGNDEWKRYFEADRYGFSNELAQHPFEGIDFLHYKNGDGISPGKPELVWKHTDWYSIISSMMIRYENVYADISFTLHNDAQVLPLLKQTLQNPVLRNKVLYGTDFYVVRNVKSDKNMLADMTGGLEKADFDIIARENPAKFLESKFSKPITLTTP